MERGIDDTLSGWNEESAQDRRNTRWALLVALGVHAVFFSLQLPETVSAEPESAEDPHFMIQTRRFEPPPPREQQVIPEPRALRVPVPDPTPDDPEPLRPSEEVLVENRLPDTDLVLGLPAVPPPEPAPGLLRVGGEVRAPVKLHAPPPRYTEPARIARIEGRVIVEATIDATGKVTRVRVIESLPLGLAQAAVDAVETWRFEPATYRGKPVAVLYNLTIYFKLT